MNRNKLEKLENATDVVVKIGKGLFVIWVIYELIFGRKWLKGATRAVAAAAKDE